MSNSNIFETDDASRLMDILMAKKKKTATTTVEGSKRKYFDLKDNSKGTGKGDHNSTITKGDPNQHQASTAEGGHNTQSPKVEYPRTIN